MSPNNQSDINRNELNSLSEFRYSILFTLAEEPQFGLGIKQELQKYYGSEVHHGQLYPNLDKLAELDMIHKEPTDSRSNNYELTDRGLAYALGRVEWAIDKLVDDDEERSQLTEKLERLALED